VQRDAVDGHAAPAEPACQRQAGVQQAEDHGWAAALQASADSSAGRGTAAFYVVGYGGRRRRGAGANDRCGAMPYGLALSVCRVAGRSIMSGCRPIRRFPMSGGLFQRLGQPVGHHVAIELALGQRACVGTHGGHQAGLSRQRRQGRCQRLAVAGRHVKHPRLPLRRRAAASHPG